MAEAKLPVAEDFPNMSDTAKRKKETDNTKPKKKITKVVKGTVRKRKKTLGRRFAEAFGAEEGQGVLDYILCDIIIPATKNMLLDSISDGVEMALFGEVRGRRRRSDYRDSRSRIQYDWPSYRLDDDRRDRRDRRDSREERRPRAAIRDFEDITFDYRSDAEEVISALVDTIEAYGQATVADLYDMVGITPDYTYGNYGWTNLAAASVIQLRNGFALDLPRPILL